MVWSTWDWLQICAFALILVTLVFVLERQGAGAPSTRELKGVGLLL